MPTQTPLKPDADNDELNVGRSHADDLFSRHGVLDEGIASREGAIDQARARLRGDEQAADNSNEAADAEAHKLGLDNPMNYNPTSQASGWDRLRSNLSFKKKGMKTGTIVSIIVALVSISMIIFSGLVSSLVNLKENIVNRVDTQTAAIEKRATQQWALKIFADPKGPEMSKGCKVKVMCKYKGISEKEMGRLKAAGVELQDAKVTKIAGVKRYTAKSLKFTDSSGNITEVKAGSQFKKAYYNNASFRGAMNTAYRGRFAAFADKFATDAFHKLRISRNTKWDATDEKDSQKQVRDSVSGEEEARQAQLKEDQAKQKPGNNNQNPEKKVDLGPYEDAANKEAATLSQDVADGKSVPKLDNKLMDVVKAPATDGISTSQKILNGVSPIGAATGFCMGYQVTNAIISVAKVAGQEHEMRYAAKFLNIADKVKAGDANPQEVTNAMNILYRQSADGETMSDSFGWAYASTGRVTSAPITSSADGGEVVRALELGISTVNSILGQSATSKVCHVVTNPVVQGLAILTNFLPGAGQLLKFGSKLMEGTAKAVVEHEIKSTIKDAIQKTVDKSLSKEARSAAKDKLKGLFTKKALAGFAMLYVIDRWGVPALGHYLSATELLGLSGDEATNAIYTGTDLVNSRTALSRGLTPLSKSEYMAYAQFNQQTQLADNQAKYANTDTAGKFAMALNSFGSKLPTINSLSDLFKLPSLSFSQSMAALSPAYAAAAATDVCQDPTVKDRFATDPFCVPQTGFPDLNALDGNETLHVKLGKKTYAVATDPESIMEFLYKHKLIDADGNEQGDYASYAQQCFDPTKTTSLPSDGDQGLPDFCYDDTPLHLVYQLYRLDGSGADPTADTEGGANLKIATFNVQGAVHAMNTWQTRIDQSINVIINNQIGVVGLQEFEKIQRQYLLQKIGDKYDIYPQDPLYGGSNGMESVNSIIWDKSKFSFVKGGFMPGLKYFGGAALHAPWVVLQDVSTGQQFYVLNTHDPAHPEYAKLRYENALAHVSFINSIKGNGLPIFFTGDFNSGYHLRLGNQGNPTYQDKNENLTYCIMTANGLTQDAYDMHMNRAAKCPQKTGSNSVDHIFMTPGLQVTSFDTVPPKQNGSDVHDTIIVGVTIPGTGSESSGSMAWPIKRSDWPSGSMPVAECGLKYSDGTVHTGMDISVPFGTPIYAAASGKVTMVSAAWGALNIQTDIKNKDGKTLYTNYQHMSRQVVKMGQTVKQGQLIGYSGHTGTTANHLHFGVWTTNDFIGGHPAANSPAGQALYSKMEHPMNYLPKDGRNVNECKPPYVVP